MQPLTTEPCTLKTCNTNKYNLKIKQNFKKAKKETGVR